MTATAIRSGLAEIAVESFGRGSPVVLLHAGVADRRMWRGQCETLAEAGFAAHAYDRRGFGDTLHVDEPWSQVGDLLAVLDHVANQRPAILVGCSQGGRIAIDACLVSPTRMRGLMVVAPAVSGAPQPETFTAPIQAWIDRVEAAEAASDVDAINALEAHAWLDGPLAPEGRVGGAVRDRFLEMNEIALRAEVRGNESAPPPAWDRVQDLTIPTLVAWGDLDFPHVARVCEHLARRIAVARRHVFTGAAHLPNMEQPVAFDRLLVSFCRSI